MKFFLGTHKTNWLKDEQFKGIPLFVSRRRLMGVKTLPRALSDWSLDSGGFSELQLFGGWETTPREYVRDVKRYVDEIGSLLWAAPQDWMCEPSMLKKTGLSIPEHQRRTVDNYLELRSLAPDLPFVPVLQGFSQEDYLDCVEMYDRVGVALSTYETVGVGSVCRRQGRSEIEKLFQTLHKAGISMHGFGVKVLGLRRSHEILTSSDSMAWSFHARRRPPLPGCTTHINCANCSIYALKWREELLNCLP